jgi:hypothetical protein
VDPEALRWLLDHGANPNCGHARGRGTALDYVIGTYARSPEQLSACIDLLLDAAGTTKYDDPGVLAVLRRQLDRLAEQLDGDATLKHRRFPELDCGSTGGRRLLLQGATLLHVAAEFGIVGAARLLLDRGADVNARTTVDDRGVGGQTAIFHAVTQSPIRDCRWRDCWWSAAPTSASVSHSRDTMSGRTKSSNARRSATRDSFRTSLSRKAARSGSCESKGLSNDGPHPYVFMFRRLTTPPGPLL